jgi:hypothetical protein
MLSSPPEKASSSVSSKTRRCKKGCLQSGPEPHFLLGKAIEVTVDGFKATPTPDELKPYQVLARLERYRLQSVARKVLASQNLMIGSCKRALIPLRSGVNVWDGKHTAYYSGLLCCGSPWVCTVCSAKISETRRAEMILANQRWKEKGGKILHMTLTVPHYAFQPLKVVLSGLAKAHYRMKHRVAWKRFSSERGLVGAVRALEVTYGPNGWHVHFHILLYLQDGTRIEEAQAQILKQWQSACLSAGLDLPDDHGCRIQDGRYADRYVSKWNIESELTQAHSKKGRDGNLGPFDILKAIAVGQKEWSTKFQEYSKAFKGRSQLRFSKGLRDILGLGKLESDEELAAKDQEEGAQFLGQLNPSQWSTILKAERRGEILEKAHNEGWIGVLALVRELTGNKNIPPY